MTKHSLSPRPAPPTFFHSCVTWFPLNDILDKLPHTTSVTTGYEERIENGSMARFYLRICLFVCFCFFYCRGWHHTAKSNTASMPFNDAIVQYWQPCLPRQYLLAFIQTLRQTVPKESMLHLSINLVSIPSTNGLCYQHLTHSHIGNATTLSEHKYVLIQTQRPYLVF